LAHIVDKYEKRRGGGSESVLGSSPEVSDTDAGALPSPPLSIINISVREPGPSQRTATSRSKGKAAVRQRADTDDSEEEEEGSTEESDEEQVASPSKAERLAQLAARAKAKKAAQGGSLNTPPSSTASSTQQVQVMLTSKTTKKKVDKPSSRPTNWRSRDPFSPDVFGEIPELSPPPPSNRSRNAAPSASPTPRLDRGTPFSEGRKMKMEVVLTPLRMLTPASTQQRDRAPLSSSSTLKPSTPQASRKGKERETPIASRLRTAVPLPSPQTPSKRSSRAHSNLIPENIIDVSDDSVDERELGINRTPKKRRKVGAA
jgi:hypothetical protein